MRAIVRRKVTPEELLERIGLAETLKDEEVLPDLLAAYMAYEEEGEYSYIVEEEVPLSLARRLLSPNMSKLIDFLKSNEGLCVSEMARALNRSPPNVYADLKFLANYNLVTFERRGRRAVPHLLMEELRILP